MDKINVREHVNPDGVFVAEDDVNQMQSDMDISQRLATYVGKKWMKIQKVPDKIEFAKEFVNTARQIIRVKKASPPNSMVVRNAEELLRTWSKVLSTSVPQSLGVRLSDLRGILEECGYIHSSPETSLKDL